MKYIYILNVRMTGCNGNIIKSIDSAYAYAYEHDAFEAGEKKWNHRPKDDPNYMVWVYGPIVFYEN